MFGITTTVTHSISITQYNQVCKQAKSANKFSSDDMKHANSLMGTGVFTDSVFNLDE